METMDETSFKRFISKIFGIVWVVFSVHAVHGRRSLVAVEWIWWHVPISTLLTTSQALRMMAHLPYASTSYNMVKSTGTPQPL